MFNKKSVFVATALCAMLGASTANAEETRCYTVASVQGSWALVGTFGANVAMSLGDRSIGEDGQFMGTFVLNGPTIGSPSGARTITTGTQVGTYAVNCDGTGTITRIVTASNGVTAMQVDDFIITRAIVERGRFIATALSDMQRVPSALVPGGVFVTRVHTRLPDGEERRR